MAVPPAVPLGRSVAGRRCLRQTPVAKAAVLAAALTLGATACANGRTSVAATAPSTPAATVSATPVPDEQALLLAQYRKFWTTLTPASRMPAPQRRTVLARVAVDPELKSLLEGMASADAKGQVLYGRNIPRPTVRVSPDGSAGLVDDCQDSGKAGVAARSTLAPLTVGVSRNHVVVTMKKQAGVWKVAFVSYTKTPC